MRNFHDQRRSTFGRRGPSFRVPNYLGVSSIVQLAKRLVIDSSRLSDFHHRQHRFDVVVSHYRDLAYGMPASCFVGITDVPMSTPEEQRHLRNARLVDPSDAQPFGSEYSSSSGYIPRSQKHIGAQLSTNSGTTRKMSDRISTLSCIMSALYRLYPLPAHHLLRPRVHAPSFSKRHNFRYERVIALHIRCSMD